MEQTKLIILVSTISCWINSPVVSVMDGLYVWVVKKGEIVLDVNERELKLIDVTLDDKTYWALHAFCASKEINVNDYFRN